MWALSCIGAWVGIIYNQAKDGKGLEAAQEFFRNVFRDDESFRSFPTNTIFSPDWFGYLNAMQDFLCEPQNYRNAFVPQKMMESFLYTLSGLRDRKNWKRFSEGDFNRWTLNHLLAVHPVSRFLTALIFKSKINGRTKLHYPDSKFLTDIKFERLYEPGKPYIFHNAWNLTKQKLQLFSNRDPEGEAYKRITPASLCACSALPLIEQTVQLDGDTYCEGALVDTVNFEDLVEDHPDLDEIWISRIVDFRPDCRPQEYARFHGKPVRAVRGYGGRRRCQAVQISRPGHRPEADGTQMDGHHHRGPGREGHQFRVVAHQSRERVRTRP